MEQKTASLAELYDPVRSDIEEVEAVLRRELSHSNPFVTTLLDHASRYRGKRLRPALALYATRVCGTEPEERHRLLAAVVEILHTATLLHDDVLDEADTRRNIDTMNRVWGNEAAILFGDYLFAKAFRICAELHDRDANLILTRAVEDICIGELSQIAAKFNCDIDEPGYLEIIRRKTAVLFATACRLGTLGTDAHPQLVQAMASFGENFGIAFQIVDDCLDITGDEHVMGKSLGTDLSKGKLTLPIIKLLRDLPPGERRSAEELLKNPDLRDRRRPHLARLVQEYDALSYAMDRARAFAEASKTALSVAPPSALTENLGALADFVVARRR